jgi:hypothetical protein
MAGFRAELLRARVGLNGLRRIKHSCGDGLWMNPRTTKISTRLCWKSELSTGYAGYGFEQSGNVYERLGPSSRTG